MSKYVGLNCAVLSYVFYLHQQDVTLLHIKRSSLYYERYLWFLLGFLLLCSKSLFENSKNQNYLNRSPRQVTIPADEERVEQRIALLMLQMRELQHASFSNLMLLESPTSALPGI